MTLTTEHRQVPETPRQVPGPPPSRSRRAIVGWAAVIAALTATGAFAVTVFNDTSDNAPPNPQAPNAVEDARGSDRHLELLAGELAGQADARQQAVEDARGSDRHLELLAAELAREDETRQQAIEDAGGSDRHLELLADELARRASAARAD
jgi:hypothetical protein